MKLFLVIFRILLLVLRWRRFISTTSLLLIWLFVNEKLKNHD